jgi:hypothetical protein
VRRDYYRPGTILKCARSRQPRYRRRGATPGWFIVVGEWPFLRAVHLCGGIWPKNGVFNAHRMPHTKVIPPSKVPGYVWAALAAWRLKGDK